MNALLQKTFAFVDIETTGSSPQGGKIIDIAIHTVKNGQIDEKWSSLVNPERPLPPIITSITGITSKELEEAPTFASLAKDIHQRLEGKIFVAHNARFDYSFIKNELKLHDIAFNAKTLCTVKLSRSLFPRFKRHNLDALIERYNLSCKNRHRAFDDAMAMIEFIKAAEIKLGPKKLEKTITHLLSAPTLPPRLDKKLIDELPEETGVYIFKGKIGHPLYIGKSRNIKKRILSHFSADHLSTKELKIKEAIYDIEVRLTEGELGALFLESRLIKEHLPLYNKKLRKLSSQTVLIMQEDEEGYLVATIKKSDELRPDHLKNAYGIFNTHRSAQRNLEIIAQEHKLCLKRLGLAKSKPGRACFDYQLKQCEGACIGEISPMAHNLKLTQALSKFKHPTWPFEGPIGIQEGHLEKSTIHIIHNWCHLGSADSEEELYEILESNADPDFEFDAYKIIRSYFKKAKTTMKVIRLNYQW